MYWEDFEKALGGSFDENGVFSKEAGALGKQVGGGHYKDLTIQPIEYCQKNELNALESFVVKYVTRHRNKNGVEDINKAIHCLELLKEIEYGETDE